MEPASLQSATLPSHYAAKEVQWYDIAANLPLIMVRGGRPRTHTVYAVSMME